MLFFFHQLFGLHPDHIEGPHPVQFLLYGFLQRQQAALSQPAVQKGKDADKGDLTDEAFLNALVVKNTKRLIEHLLIKGALLQRIGMSLVDGLFCALTFPPFKQVRMVWPSISIRHSLFVAGLRKVFSIMVLTVPPFGSGYFFPRS